MAMVTITAKLTAYTFSVDDFDTDMQIDSLLSLGTLEGDILGQTPSLDQFRAACLLAFYEFHQFPGHRAWMRVGELIRMAYRIGIDRIESLRARYIDWGSVGEAELQEWRLVWWCVYRLDSYSNLSTGTPYLVEQDNIYTALIQGSLDCVFEAPPVLDKLYIPPDPIDLWKIMPSVVSEAETSLFNLHIVTAAALRQVGSATRVQYLRPPEEIVARLRDIERSHSALRLALPTNYLNPYRNAFANESSSDHHARLVTVFHLLMAQLLMAIFRCFRTDEGDRENGWQQVLECCQNIASIAEQWNGSFSIQVDPAVALIVFTALVFLDLHKKSEPSPPSAVQTNIEHCKTILLLQLEQFANMWTLPRLLIRK
jgi:hypothetical protein